MQYYFDGVWRMDWGFGNPNKTGTFIATLMIAVWSLDSLRKSGFWLALFLNGGLGFCLLHSDIGFEACEDAKEMTRARLHVLSIGIQWNP